MEIIKQKKDGYIIRIVNKNTHITYYFNGIHLETDINLAYIFDEEKKVIERAEELKKEYKEVDILKIKKEVKISFETVEIKEKIQEKTMSKEEINNYIKNLKTRKL
jgi:hypothetical protein